MRAQYAQFLAVGFSNALVDLGTLNILLVLYPTRAALSLLADNTFAVALAILNSYLWNTRWTFRETATRSLRQRVLFGLQALLNIALNNLVLLSLSGLLPPARGIWYLIGSNAVKLVAMLVASTTSFVMLRTVVFRARRNQARPGGGRDGGRGALGASQATATSSTSTSAATKSREAIPGASPVACAAGGHHHIHCATLADFPASKERDKPKPP